MFGLSSASSCQSSFTTSSLTSFQSSSSLESSWSDSWSDSLSDSWSDFWSESSDSLGIPANSSSALSTESDDNYSLSSTESSSTTIFSSRVIYSGSENSMASTAIEPMPSSSSLDTHIFSKLVKIRKLYQKKKGTKRIKRKAP